MQIMEAKGSVIETIPLFVRSKFGEIEYNKWMDSLSKNARELFRGTIVTYKWYPFKEMLEEPTIRVCDMFFDGKVEGAEEQGRFSAEYGLKGFYKVFMKLGSPHYLVKKGSDILKTYYQPCDIEIVDLGDKTSTMRITKFEEPSKVVEHRIAGWMNKALEISGVTTSTVKISRSLADGAPFTDFVAAW
jgi:hypothetical protein